MAIVRDLAMDSVYCWEVHGMGWGHIRGFIFVKGPVNWGLGGVGVRLWYSN